MHTRWLRGGSARDDLSLWSSPSLRTFHLGGLRDYPAHRTAHDDPLRRLLLCPLCRWNDRRELGDVAHQALGPEGESNGELQSPYLSHTLGAGTVLIAGVARWQTHFV